MPDYLPHNYYNFDGTRWVRWNGHTWQAIDVAQVPPELVEKVVGPPAPSGISPPTTTAPTQTPSAAANNPELAKLHRKAQQAIEANLNAGEQIHVVIQGTSKQVIVGTDRRAFVYKKGFMAGASFGSEVTSFAYQSISGVQVHTGMLSGAVIIQSSGHQSGTSTRGLGGNDADPLKAPNAIPIARPYDQAQAGAARLRALIDAVHNAEPHSQPAPHASMSTDSSGSPSNANHTYAPISPADELIKLAGLRDTGVISEQEFQQMKSRIIHPGN